MATFVLVHGSWHGGWCWRSVIPLLRAKGHEVFAPTLTGLGERSHVQVPRIDLALHIEDILQVLRYEDLQQVVLVGHSYAGMVITGVAAAAPERIARLVYLDAYIPADGQSEFALWPESEQRAAQEDLAAGRNFRRMVPASLFGVHEPEQAAWVEAHLTPHPLTTYLDPPPSPTAESARVPRAFIHCTEPGPIAARTQLFADHGRGAGWPVITLSTGHDAMLTAPKDLARVLLDLAI